MKLNLANDCAIKYNRYIFVCEVSLTPTSSTEKRVCYSILDSHV